VLARICDLDASNPRSLLSLDLRNVLSVQKRSHARGETHKMKKVYLASTEN